MQVCLNDVLIEYDTFGNPHDQALLLISGLNTPMTRWSPEFCIQLAKSGGYYVIRFDNRDCGLSQHFDGHKPPSNLRLLLAQFLGLKVDPVYTLKDMANDAIHLMDALGVEKAFLLGRSMGGMIAQLIASDYPNRVLGLTVMMSTTGNRQLPGPSLNVLWMLLRRKPNPKNSLGAYLDYRVAYTHAIGSPRYPLAAFDIRSRILADLGRSGFHPGAAKRQLAAFVAAGDISGFTRKIRVATVIIHGDSDRLVPYQAGLDIHRNIAGSKFVLIKDRGHALQPEFFNVIIEQMMK